MTTLLYTVGVLCLFFVFGIGFAVGHRRSLAQWKSDVRRLEGTLEGQVKALKSAEVDQEIVRALREGDIGVDDLHSVGFEKVRQEATGNILEFAAPENEEESESEYQPFNPLPYKREISTLDGMTPRDQVWVSMSAIRHSGSGEVTMWTTATCSHLHSSARRCRLRKLETGEYELAIDPGDPETASGGVTDASFIVKYVTVLRPEDRYRGVV